jgi:hypothetical protein
MACVLVLGWEAKIRAAVPRHPQFVVSGAWRRASGDGAAILWDMPTGPSALPFALRRSSDVYAAKEITSTVETVHGLVRIDGERLVVQWRVARSTDRYGSEIRTDREVEPVREASVPLAALAGAAVRWRWRWPPGPHLVLTAADLRAFEQVAGDAGLRLDHPAELWLPLRRADRAAAAEFAGDVALAAAEQALRATDERDRLAPGA